MLNIEAIRRVAWENMGTRRVHKEREIGYIYYHGLRTANIAGEILYLVHGKREDFDEIMFTGSLFHDVGKGFGIHNEAGAAIARHLLGDLCAQDKLDKICKIVRLHCIRDHRLDFSNQIRAVQDADIIDHYGTQQIWLGISRAAHHGETSADILGHWSGDEFRNHLDELRELLNFQESLSIFNERIDSARQFIDRFRVESEGRLFAGPIGEDRGSGGSPDP